MMVIFHLLELLAAEVGEDVALGGGEDLEGNCAMVVFQWASHSSLKFSTADRMIFPTSYFNLYYFFSNSGK